MKESNPERAAVSNAIGEGADGFPDTIIENPLPEIVPELLEEAYRIPNQPRSTVVSGNKPWVPDITKDALEVSNIEEKPGVADEILKNTPLPTLAPKDADSQKAPVDWKTPAPIRQTQPEKPFWKKILGG